MKRKLNIKNNSSVASEKTQLRGVNAMKTNKIKKAVLAVTLAASMAIPTATLSSVMTAHAASNVPFCADTDNNGAFNIQEDQIYVSRSYYEAITKTFSTEVTDEVNDLYIDDNTRFICSKGSIKVNPLAKYVLSFVVTGDNLTESNADNIRLHLDFTTKDKSGSKQVKPSLIVPKGPNTYYVSYNFYATGESLSFYSNIITDPTIRCSKASITATLDNEDYYQIEAKPAGGEKLFIRIKIDESISWDKMETWAKRLCMYANSLSVTTGIKLDTLYMLYDDELYDGVAHSENSIINAHKDKYGYVSFNPGITDLAREQIDSGRNVITWGEMHEIAHSYGTFASSSFEENYLFLQNGCSFFDEYLTNARGITAIQNCDNLRNTDIVFETVGFYGKYDTMLHDVYKNDPYCDMFGFASGLGFLPWDQLEEYFAATSDNDPYLTESREVAKMINQYIGMDIPFSKNYLKFANTIRKLMKLNNNGVYDESKFTSFMTGKFSKELVKEIVTNLKF